MKLDNLKFAEQMGGKFICENNDSPMPLDILAHELNKSVRMQSKVLDLIENLQGMIMKQQEFIQDSFERIEDLRHYLNDALESIDVLEMLHYDDIFDEYGEYKRDSEPAD